MLIPRRLPNHIKNLGSFFPIISVTGPRQSGKTTLLKEMYPNYKYVSLENPNVRLAAQEDPIGFLKTYDDKVIFDEAQRFPDLFSYLQGMVDEDRTPGRFIISGSQNFLLRKNITQSLAGRVGIAKLLPLDNQELKSANLLPFEHEEAIYKGGYPALISKRFENHLFYGGYLSSYVERDVLELISATNLDLFQTFLRVCATYAGQAVNYSKMSNDVGVSVPTVQSWLSILEQSYLVFRLKPFFRNLGKRLNKAPKLYFYDTGLLCHLLRFSEVADVERTPLRGALFENLIIADAHKSLYHQGYEPWFYYYRDQAKLEADLVYERANSAELWEIKSTRTFKPNLIKTVEKVASYWDRPVETSLIYAGDEEHLFSRSSLVNWRNLEWKK